MSSTAQAESNRRNAKASTGPRTAAGKAASSQNACKLNLFSTRNFVLPQDEPEYNELTTALWDRLNPQDALEGVYAIEILRATWRLRRCANVEADLADKALSRAEKDAAKNGHQDPADAMLHASLAEIQTSVDRARTQALGILNRATAELRRLQTERRLRVETLPAQFEPARLGISDTTQITKGITAAVNAQLDLAKIEQIKLENALHAAAFDAIPPIPVDTLMKRFDKKPAESAETTPAAPETKQTETPRNAACTCGSGRKFKRCCGVAAPPILHQTAAAAHAGAA